jgi:hypothetical protein
MKFNLKTAMVFGCALIPFHAMPFQLKSQFSENSEDQLTLHNFNIGLAFQTYGDQNRAITFLKSSSLSARSPNMRLLPDVAIARIYLSEGIYRTAFPILADVYEQSKIMGAPLQTTTAASLLLLAETSLRNHDLNKLRRTADMLSQFEFEGKEFDTVEQSVQFTGKYYLSLLSKLNGNPELSLPLKEALTENSNTKASQKPIITSEQTEKLRNLSAEPSIVETESNFKSPAIAGLLSLVVPGAGHFYANRWQNGLTAFGFTMLTAATSKWAFNNGEKVFGTTMTGISALFYLGQFAGAMRQVNLYNQGKLRNFQNDLVSKYGPRSSLKIEKNGVTFSWEL